eukprot:TRINITY_DN9163_c0_g1_i1.p1 TRINITY_DN9163_c0_g1~~TRINITY_DN9163_c0_g1_i1.p1  ORF type:complete len:1198 (-),score=210.24 TRINITY_DN9163_c0_g1_i1:9-3602(-)
MRYISCIIASPTMVTLDLSSQLNTAIGYLENNTITNVDAWLLLNSVAKEYPNLLQEHIESITIQWRAILMTTKRIHIRKIVTEENYLAISLMYTCMKKKIVPQVYIDLISDIVHSQFTYLSQATKVIEKKEKHLSSLYFRHFRKILLVANFLPKESFIPNPILLYNIVKHEVVSSDRTYLQSSEYDEPISNLFGENASNFDIIWDFSFSIHTQGERSLSDDSRASFISELLSFFPQFFSGSSKLIADLVLEEKKVFQRNREKISLYKRNISRNKILLCVYNYLKHQLDNNEDVMNVTLDEIQIFIEEFLANGNREEREIISKISSIFSLISGDNNFTRKLMNTASETTSADMLASCCLALSEIVLNQSKTRSKKISNLVVELLKDLAFNSNLADKNIFQCLEILSKSAGFFFTSQAQYIIESVITKLIDCDYSDSNSQDILVLCSRIVNNIISSAGPEALMDSGNDLDFMIILYLLESSEKTDFESIIEMRTSYLLFSDTIYIPEFFYSIMRCLRKGEDDVKHKSISLLLLCINGNTNLCYSSLDMLVTLSEYNPSIAEKIIDIIEKGEIMFPLNWISKLGTLITEKIILYENYLEGEVPAVITNEPSDKILEVCLTLLLEILSIVDPAVTSVKAKSLLDLSLSFGDRSYAVRTKAIQLLKKCIHKFSHVTLSEENIFLSKESEIAIILKSAMIQDNSIPLAIISTQTLGEFCILINTLKEKSCEKYTKHFIPLLQKLDKSNPKNFPSYMYNSLELEAMVTLAKIHHYSDVNVLSLALGIEKKWMKAILEYIIFNFIEYYAIKKTYEFRYIIGDSFSSDYDKILLGLSNCSLNEREKDMLFGLSVRNLHGETSLTYLRCVNNMILQKRESLSEAEACELFKILSTKNEFDEVLYEIYYNLIESTIHLESESIKTYIISILEDILSSLSINQHIISIINITSGLQRSNIPLIASLVLWLFHQIRISKQDMIIPSIFQAIDTILQNQEEGFTQSTILSLIHDIETNSDQTLIALLLNSLLHLDFSMPESNIHKKTLVIISRNFNILQLRPVVLKFINRLLSQNQISNQLWMATINIYVRTLTPLFLKAAIDPKTRTVSYLTEFLSYLYMISQLSQDKIKSLSILLKCISIIWDKKIQALNSNMDTYLLQLSTLPEYNTSYNFLTEQEQKTLNNILSMRRPSKPGPPPTMTIDMSQYEDE